MQLDMTKGSPFKLILKFIIPIIIGNIFQQFYSMVDTIIVGRYVGVQALAAVGATGTIGFLILGFSQGLTTGFTIITGQRFGAGDEEGIKKSVGSATLLTLIVIVIMTLGSVLLMEPLLTIMNTPEDIYEMSRTYILIICYGLVGNLWYNLVASLLRAVGNSQVPLYFLIFSAFLNIFLDLLFVVNFQMGVAGAAWATVLSQLLAGILCHLYILKKVPLLRAEWRHYRLEGHLPWIQLKIGIPMALQFCITAIGTIILQSALNLLGSMVVASYTAACKVEQLVTQPFVAMGVTMSTYSAQNLGTNDLTRIRKGVRAANLMSAVYSVIIYGVVILLMPYLIRLFVSENLDEVLHYADIYIKVCGLFFIPLGMIFIFRNVLQGCGYGFLPMLGGVVELLSRGVLAIMAAHRLSYVGVCLANASAWCSAGIFLWIAYYPFMKKLSCRMNRSAAPSEVR